MTKSSSDPITSLGCGPSLLALVCFGLMVAILVASVSGRFRGENAEVAVSSEPAPSNNVADSPAAPGNEAVLSPAQVAAPVFDCGQIADAAQRQQCEESATLCENGCSEYPLGCDLLAIKGAIDKQSGQKIYYTQQHLQYTQILIEPATGERWFCAATAAERAGWARAP